jgi:putative ABC transport system substrate-binding protein
MKRRTLMLYGLSVSLAAAMVEAQRGPTPLPLVVLIATADEEQSKPAVRNLLRGLEQSGQVEGRTFRFRVRYADGDPGRFPALIRESLVENPSVLVVVGLVGARAARDATSTIPVVVGTSSDLVDAGIVRSYARPGGNITGVSDLTDESAAKRLELLKAALPDASRVALLINTAFPASQKIEARVRATAAPLGITITPVYMQDRASMLRAVDSLPGSRPDALLVGGDPVSTTYRRQLIERASALRIPAIHYWPDSAEQGAILSLQVDVYDNYRRAGGYVDKILRGARAGDLPIHQPTRYDLIVNVKAAKALGITIPQPLLLRADKVIQ